MTVIVVNGERFPQKRPELLQGDGAMWVAWFLPDGCDWAAWAFLLLPPSLLFLRLLLAVVRRWNARAVARCPRCKAAPAALDVLNVCWRCRCEYDKWGNLLKEPPPPPQLDAVDLAPFDAKRKRPDADDDHYHRPGLTQEPTP